MVNREALDNLTFDSNGYSKSIMQDDLSRCYLCGGSSVKLDRHEVFGASNRKKSKELGLWVLLCHRPCHLSFAHGNRETMDSLHRRGQIAAMNTYGWNIDKFRSVIGRNYL